MRSDCPSVLLRADMDALPVKKATGLPYASTVTTTDHSPLFAPVVQPTLDTGTAAMVVAALAWLAPNPGDDGDH